MFARVISETLNVRSSPATGNNILGVLTKGQIVTVKKQAPDAPRWSVVEYNGREAFASRRFLAQSPDAPLTSLSPEMQRLVSEVILSATQRYDAITYRLGCKAKGQGMDRLVFSGSDVDSRPCSGTTVDCSGWVAGLFQLIANTVNSKSGAEIFSAKAVGALITHSDGQIVNAGNATGQIYSGTDIDGLPLRSGLIFGLNNGDYDWEGQDRVFGIDHIVMGVSGADGFYITQSSSSGGGVNKVAWSRWRQANSSKFNGFRVYCVDLLSAGAWNTPRGRKKSTPIDLGDKPFSAPAG